MTVFPFEVPFEDIEANIDAHISAVFSCLESGFLTMPRGDGFVEYDAFENAYETMKKETSGFSEVTGETLLKAVYSNSVAFIVIRTMLGFTPPEWAYVTTQRSSVRVTQGAVRGIDRKLRISPDNGLPKKGVSANRIKAMVEVAAQYLKNGALATKTDEIHRLDKADTKQGLVSLSLVADFGVPYAMLLYERFLGRPFASHRDSISELVGDTLELAIEKVLNDAGISNVKTKRAQVIPGFDQAAP